MVTERSGDIRLYEEPASLTDKLVSILSADDLAHDRVPALESAVMLLAGHIDLLLKNEEGRLRLTFGDYLVLTYDDLPTRLLVEAIRDLAPLIPLTYALHAASGMVSLSRKRTRLEKLKARWGWGWHLEPGDSDPEAWFVKFDQSPNSSDGLGEPSVKFEKAPPHVCFW